MDAGDGIKKEASIPHPPPKSSKHSRSKSQTIVSMKIDPELELSKHFERSLNRNYHAKSKSLPRPMRERNLPSSFFIENNITPTGSCDSLKKKPRQRTKSKEQLRKSNSLSRSYNKKLLDTVNLNVKSEPVSPGSLKVSSPGSCYSSASSPQSQTTPSSTLSVHQPIIGHHRSRSCPVQSHVPKAPQRKKKLNATLETDTPQQKGIPAPFEIDVNRIRLPPHWSIGNSNGMLYYVDHQNKTTTYDDPRIQIREKLKYEHQMLCMNEMLELPPGYERRIKIDTQEIFYVNHNTRTTSWIHPKIEQLLIPEEELNNANIQFPSPPLQMETENPQQQNFQNFDYFGSPNGQTPQNTNQPSSGGGSMLMNRLEHDFHDTQFPSNQNQFDADYHSYVQKTVGWQRAHHMQQGTSSSLPTRFNPLSRTNRSSPISHTSSFQPQREMIGHRRQRSLDQLRMDQLRIGSSVDSPIINPVQNTAPGAVKPFTEEDLDLIREIDVQPLDGGEMSEELLNQLINDHTSFAT